MKINNYTRPPNRQLQYMNTNLNKKENMFTTKPAKPRSMHRVLSDIEFCINNDLPIEVIETDIHQLVSQLTAVLGKVKEGDNKKAFEIMNPAINYYKL